MKRAVFLDRDGVINRKAPAGGYVTRWEDFRFLFGVAEGISQLNRGGWSVIVVSNQRCIALGLLTVSQLEEMHHRMCEELAAKGARLDGIYYCPHEKEPPCACRKPAPGMLLTAADEHQILLPSSWMVGDSESDLEAGKRAGCKTVQIVEDPSNMKKNVDCTARSLLEACQQILHMADMLPGKHAGDLP